MPVWLRWTLLAIVSLGAALGSQAALRRVPPPELDVNMLFVPPRQVTRGLASGHENLVADSLWLGLIQYYGDRVVTEGRHCVNLVPMFDLITDLDPKFWFAYWLGAWAMLDNGESESAVKLLTKGAAKNPGDYNYPYTRGFILYLGLKDYAAAAASFEEAARLPGAPRFAKTMAARMYETRGRGELALAIWRSLYESPTTDDNTRRIAKRNVARILAELKGEREPTWKRRPATGR